MEFVKSLDAYKVTADCALIKVISRTPTDEEIKNWRAAYRHSINADRRGVDKAVVRHFKRMASAFEDIDAGGSIKSTTDIVIYTTEWTGGTCYLVLIDEVELEGKKVMMARLVIRVGSVCRTIIVLCGNTEILGNDSDKYEEVFEQLSEHAKRDWPLKIPYTECRTPLIKFSFKESDAEEYHKTIDTLLDVGADQTSDIVQQHLKYAKTVGLDLYQDVQAVLREVRRLTDYWKATNRYKNIEKLIRDSRGALTTTYCKLNVAGGTVSYGEWVFKAKHRYHKLVVLVGDVGFDVEHGECLREVFMNKLLSKQNLTKEKSTMSTVEISKDNNVELNDVKSGGGTLFNLSESMRACRTLRVEIKRLEAPNMDSQLYRLVKGTAILNYTEQLKKHTTEAWARFYHTVDHTGAHYVEKMRILSELNEALTQKGVRHFITAYHNVSVAYGSVAVIDIDAYDGEHYYSGSAVYMSPVTAASVHILAGEARKQFGGNPDHSRLLDPSTMPKYI